MQYKRWKGKRNKREVEAVTRVYGREKLETVTLPVMQLTSPDRVKKKKKKKEIKRRSVQEPGEKR